MKKIILAGSFFMIHSLLFAGKRGGQFFAVAEVEITGCETVTKENVARVSGFVRAPGRSKKAYGSPADVASSVPGLLIEGITKRIRTKFSYFPPQGDPSMKDTGWEKQRKTEPDVYFFPIEPGQSCRDLQKRPLVYFQLINDDGCDTYPPRGLCAFNSPVRLADEKTWALFK